MMCKAYQFTKYIQRDIIYEIIKGIPPFPVY